MIPITRVRMERCAGYHSVAKFSVEFGGGDIVISRLSLMKHDMDGKTEPGNLFVGYPRDYSVPVTDGIAYVTPGDSMREKILSAAYGAYMHLEETGTRFVDWQPPAST